MNENTKEQLSVQTEVEVIAQVDDNDDANRSGRNR